MLITIFQHVLVYIIEIKLQTQHKLLSNKIKVERDRVRDQLSLLLHDLKVMIKESSLIFPSVETFTHERKSMFLVQCRPSLQLRCPNGSFLPRKQRLFSGDCGGDAEKCVGESNGRL